VEATSQPYPRRQSRFDARTDAPLIRSRLLITSEPSELMRSGTDRLHQLAAWLRDTGPCILLVGDCYVDTDRDGQHANCAGRRAFELSADVGQCDERISSSTTRQHDLHHERHGDAARTAWLYCRRLPGLSHFSGDGSQCRRNMPSVLYSEERPAGCGVR
jgi:hypothetical protein